ncbi:MAG: ATP phosphoribosyltransferase [Bacteroidetes bacterium]|jgi:ATP phosphoribosyltransferase|nr:ATP phosphoribosyltransferase [Bacteroidota bacterium]
MTMNLKIAIQKSGRLSEKSLELIQEAGVKLIQGKRKLISVASNFPVEILYLRDDDIPQYVQDGVADIGIVGENEVLEKNKHVKIAERLGFAKCRLSLAIPQDVDYPGSDYFNGKRIATSYAGILGRYLKENNIDAAIEEISGSVEIAPSIGLADAIFDIVSSGGTLVSNRLKEVEIVLNSEAVIIKKQDLEGEKQQILEELIFRIHAVQRSHANKYILLNAPNENIGKITALLPGMKSPTVMPLATEGWSSLHSVVNENEFWEVIGKLKEYGAEGILVIPIEKMIL